MKAVQLKNEIIWDWMRPEVASIQLSASVGEAVERMAKLDVHHLVVMEGKKFRGILDARDLAGVSVEEAGLGEFTRSDVVPVDENTDIGTVVKRLVGCGVTAIPLKRGDVVKGILTSTDMLRLLDAELEGKSDLSNLVEKGKVFLTRPLFETLNRLLTGAGL